MSLFDTSYGARLALQATREYPDTIESTACRRRTSPIVGRTLWDLCEVWDVEAGAEETFEPVDSEVPLFVVTGQFDQITPPSYGETVADAAETGRSATSRRSGMPSSP